MSSLSLLPIKTHTLCLCISLFVSHLSTKVSFTHSPTQCHTLKLPLSHTFYVSLLGRYILRLWHVQAHALPTDRGTNSLSVSLVTYFSWSLSLFFYITLFVSLCISSLAYLSVFLSFSLSFYITYLKVNCSLSQIVCVSFCHHLTMFLSPFLVLPSESTCLSLSLFHTLFNSVILTVKPTHTFSITQSLSHTHNTQTSLFKCSSEAQTLTHKFTLRLWGKKMTRQQQQKVEMSVGILVWIQPNALTKNLIEIIICSH